MKDAPLPPVRKSLVVPLAREIAFDLFTRRLGEWWPLAQRSATVDARSCDVEPRVGGRLFERTRHGTESLWGVYSVFDEPSRVVFSWHPGAPESAATEVRVVFTEVGEATRVDLEHRNWEKLGDRAALVRGFFEGGWIGVLGRFTAIASNEDFPEWIETPGCLERV